MKTLIVYYTWHNGNTGRIAQMIKEKIDADICAIETVEPYPEEYRKASDQGKEECETGFTPEIRSLPYDVKDYDRIIIGTPTWWYTMAPAVRSFLKNNDWKGKIVIPFMTYAGWSGTVIKDMISLCVGADIRHPYEVLFDSEGGPVLKSKVSNIGDWIAKIR